MDMILDGGSDGRLDIHYVPLCPNCGGEEIFRRHSVKKVTRAEWEADADAREAERERNRRRGRFVINVQTPGWDDNWTECWTMDKLEAVVCDDCDFSAATDKPFTEARKQLVEKKEAAKRCEFERTSALPLDDPEHWCGYCEDNCYDTISCPECGGKSCGDCAQHGYIGYSW